MQSPFEESRTVNLHTLAGFPPFSCWLIQYVVKYNTVTDTQLHIGREKLDDYIPPTHRLHQAFPQGVAQRGENGLKCSKSSFLVLEDYNFRLGMSNFCHFLVG